MNQLLFTSTAVILFDICFLSDDMKDKYRSILQQRIDNLGFEIANNLF